MNQKSFAGWLKVTIIGIAVIGFLCYLYIFPHFGSELLEAYIGNDKFYLPWIIFSWITAVPCYIVLYYGWKMAREIGADRSFSLENAKSLTKICYVTAVDIAIFFVGNIVFLLLGGSNALIMMISLFLDFAGVVVIVVCSTASHLVAKAAGMQEENELTI